MAYNATRTFYISGQLYWRDEDAWRLACRSVDPELDPECCFLRDEEPDIESFTWSGEGSGASWDHLIKDVLPLTRGEASIMVVWEGGDDFSILRVVDGKVTEHEVEFAAGEERKNG